MKRVAGKVAKIDDFFGRKSKISKGKLKKCTKKSTGLLHAIKFSWTILRLFYNIAIQILN